MTLGDRGLPVDALAEFAANASVGSSQERLSIHITDGVIALLAGHRSREGKSLSTFFSRTDPSTLGKLSANAAAMRLSEIDDIHRSSGVTSSAIALPPALAMSAFTQVEPQRFSDAVMVGQSVAIELALSMGGARLMSRGMWPTYLVAPVGAAATAGRMLGLPTSRMRQALAIALAQTPRSVGRSVGPLPARWLLFANAVRTGCLAALAASEGIDGDPSLLDEGWLKSVGGDLALPGVATPITRVNELSIKPHCAAKQTLAAIQALQLLMADGLDVLDIQAIEVRVPTAYAAMIDREPPSASRLASMVSVRWQLALAALHPNLLDDVSRDQFPADMALQDLASKVQIIGDSSLDSLYPHTWPAHLKVISRRNCCELLVKQSLGDPQFPLGATGIQAKAKRILADESDIALILQASRVTFDASSLAQVCGYFV